MTTEKESQSQATEEKKASTISEKLTLDEIIGRTIGHASMLWEHVDKAGIFQSDEGSELTNTTVQQIKDLYAEEKKVSTISNEQVQYLIKGIHSYGLLWAHLLQAGATKQVVQNALDTAIHSITRDVMRNLNLVPPTEKKAEKKA